MAKELKVSTDEGLIKYLMRRIPPFEMCEIKYHVKLPIYSDNGLDIELQMLTNIQHDIQFLIRSLYSFKGPIICTIYFKSSG